jgi:ankyrin repeat protein
VGESLTPDNILCLEAGMTALHWAASGGKTDLCRLLKEYEVNVTLEDNVSVEKSKA